MKRIPVILIGMSLHVIVIAIYVIAAIFALRALSHGFAARRCLRERRGAIASWRGLWMLVTLAFGITFGLVATMLLGYHRLGSEARVATVETRQLAPQRYAVDLTFPDGSRRSAEIEGDQWQLDARIIKWRSTALLLGAQPLYRLDRLSGRYRKIEDTTKPMTAVDLSGDDLFDLADVKERFPTWLPWVDADYGSAAFLPLVDNGRFEVTLSAAGGLVARPADDATESQLKLGRW